MSEALQELIDVCNSNECIIESLSLYDREAYIRDFYGREVHMRWTGTEWVVWR